MNASPIRPGFMPPVAAPAAADSARLAQRAFFQAALGPTLAVQTAAPPPRAAPTQAAAATTVETTTNGVERFARPGSRLDIRV